MSASIEPITDVEIWYVNNRVEHGIYRRRVPLELMLKALARIERHDAEIARMHGIRRNLLTRIQYLDGLTGDRIDD